MLFSTSPSMTALVAAAGDPASTRTVYAIVIVLALIGCVLIGLAIWVIRRTRVDPELLGPLERMDDRRWRKLDTVGRRRLLDDVRPEGAEPVERLRTRPEFDSDFGRGAPPLPSFDDLEPLSAESSGTLAMLDELLGLADADPPDDDPGDGDPGDDASGVVDSEGTDSESTGPVLTGSEVTDSGDSEPEVVESRMVESGDDDSGLTDSGDDESGVFDSGVFAGDHGGDPAVDDDR